MKMKQKRIRRNVGRGVDRSARYRILPSPPNAEIILKEGFFGDSTGDVDIARPWTVIAANADGFDYLADVFRCMARRARELEPDSSGDHHEHFLAMWVGETGASEMGDEIEWMLRVLNDTNRAYVYEKFNICPETAKRGSIVARYRQLAEAAESAEREWNKR